MKFRLSVVDNSPEQMFGNTVNIETAKNLQIFHTESINTLRLSDTQLRYNTGFIPEPIKRNKYFTSEEKEVLLKAQKEAANRFREEVLGDKKANIDESNKYFWEQPENGSLVITLETSRTIYDTSKMNHLLLYWQIMSDAFGLVGVNLDHAISKNAPYFLQELKDAEVRESEEEMSKIDAFGLLSELKAKGDNEALLYLCWSLGDKKDKMQGFTKATQGATLMKSLYNYINGDTKDSRKKQTVREFTRAYTEYNSDKDKFMIKVVVKVLDYHNQIFTNKENMYVTQSGVLLGNTIEESIEKLSKKGNSDILEELTKEAMVLLNE
jgi:hypothetical protein